MTEQEKRRLVWVKAVERDELPEGRVKSVTCQHRTVCLSHFEGQYAALDNRCPHQGGPLGEGAIENGWLRCPWHGWDFHPLSGAPPGGYDDGVETFETEVRDDGVYVAFPEAEPRALSVTDVMAETMVNWGVCSFFGMVGHSNLGLADAIRVQEQKGNLRFFGVRHEGAAAFACSAYGKLTGRPAACLTIAGPGATNLLTGLWDAHVDRAPVLALTGQVDTQVVGPGAFQEIDLAAAFGKVAQFTQPVLHTSRHAELVNLACKSSILNRGVSHLIFPDEVQTLPAPANAQPGGPDGRLPLRSIAPPHDALEDAMRRIESAKRPAVVVGHGARFEMEAVIELAEALDAPVITTFKGKGLISDAHPLGCGVLGRSGTPVASWFMNESDLLIVFGASFSNHTGIDAKKPIIQVDFDPMMLGKSHPVAVPMLGDVGVTARAMKAPLEGRAATPQVRTEIAERWRIWREEKTKRRTENKPGGVDSASLFDALTRATPEDAILCVDVGNNTYSFGRYFECRRQSILMSGYLGAIGFSFPAAMGAWAATQEAGSRFKGRRVVSVSGDGGFGQYLAEVNTAVLYDMDITHVILNNGELGKISKEQRGANFDVWQTKLHNPRFSAYAKICGAKGWLVKQQDELETALQEALAHRGPSIVEVMTHAELI